MATKKFNMYLTPEREQALEKVYQLMKRRNIPCEYGGKPNHAMIIEYALKELIDADSKKPKK